VLGMSYTILGFRNAGNVSVLFDINLVKKVVDDIGSCI
jgi:hypothetical protein